MVKKWFKQSMIFFVFMAFMVILISGMVYPLRTVMAEPSGSYSKSCKDCTDDGSQLICQCSYKNKYSGTSLYYNICENNSIWNDKGKLKCTPRGSFKKSCSNIYWNESRIQAVCNTKKNKKNGTVLHHYSGCTEDIANCNGVLTCGGCP